MTIEVVELYFGYFFLTMNGIHDLKRAICVTIAQQARKPFDVFCDISQH